MGNEIDVKCPFDEHLTYFNFGKMKINRSTSVKSRNENGILIVNETRRDKEDKLERSERSSIDGIGRITSD